MSAKEMFMEMDYKCIKDNEEELVYRDIYNEDLYICFLKKFKVITGLPTYDCFCDMKLLKAYNKQVEELGWNNE